MSFRNYVHHHVAMSILIGFCVWLSLSLIGRLWLKYRSDGAGKKVFWSLVLCVPFFGWLLYGAFYSPLSENNVRANENPLAMSGGDH
jgi:uncharacterized membrane protein